MQRTPSPFTFAEVIGSNRALKKETEPRPVNLISVKLIHVKNYVRILLFYQWKP